MSDRIIFTPYMPGEREPDNPLRAYMQISKEDKGRIDALPERTNADTVEVFDIVSQQSYIVRRADCGGNCYCAAEIVCKGNRTERHY